MSVWLPIFYALLMSAMVGFFCFFWGRQDVQDELLKYDRACFARGLSVHCMIVIDDELK